MSRPITGRDIRKQLKADLIGKDSHRGITLTYAWMANQFGHFSLGFIPTFILYSILQKSMGFAVAVQWSPLIISLTWLAFETYNFLGPLLKGRNSKSKLLFVPGNPHRFEPAWGNIAFDTFTDLLFFWIGAYTASVSLHFSITALVVVIVLIAAVIYPARFWFLTKMYLQIPQYPLQFRLSQWENKIDTYEMNMVEDFIKNRVKGMHLMLFGSKGSGKTSLAVAMATELSIKHCTCSYTTAMKLYCAFFEGPEKRSPSALWNWRNASVLVIDDLNPGDPIEDDIVSPEAFLKFLNTGTTNDGNIKCLKEKNVLWVLGNEHSAKETAGTWADMLIKLGVKKEKIASINLLQNEAE